MIVLETVSVLRIEQKRQMVHCWKLTRCFVTSVY